MPLSAEVRRAARAGDPVALARMLVATPSVNPRLDPDGEGEGAVARLCAGWLAGWGFTVRTEEVEPGRPNVVAVLGEGSPHLLLNGHLDTVGVRGMEVPPFAATVRDGRLHGRGSCDMKGGVASLLAAAARLAEDPPPGILTVALTVDEEEEARGVQHLIGSGVRADAAVVCEPTSLAVAPAHKGFLWAAVEFKGREAHGSRPEEGVDAIAAAGPFLASLGTHERRLATGDAHPRLGHGSIHAGTVEGGSAPSIYPGRCRIVVERRTLPGESEEGVLEEIRALLLLPAEEDGRARTAPAARGSADPSGEGPASTAETSVESLLWRPGTEVEENHPLVEGLLSAAEEEGVEPRLTAMSAWVDAGFLNEAGIPAVCFGPGSIAQAHSADEWVRVEDVARAAGVLERFARSYLRGRPVSATGSG